MVGSIGPDRANILFVSCVQGETELRDNVPIAGLSKSTFDSMLEESGIKDGEYRVVHIGDMVDLGVLALGSGANVVVPLGEEALKQICGLDKILNYRGSVLNIAGIKTIPCIHPTSVMREWSYRPITVLDFKKVKENSTYPDVRILNRELVVCYNFEQAKRELEEIRRAEYVAFDIETETNQITAIGFATRPDRAVSIPFWFGDSGSLFPEVEERVLWGILQGILEGLSKKTAHNASYDIGELHRTLGIKTQGLHIDTMAAFHVLHPELPKSLAFLTSIYTDQPYYKFERKTTDMDAYFRYNARDCAVTYEIACRIEEELKEEGLWDFYIKYVHNLIQPLIDMEAKGVRYDNERAKELRKEYKKEAEGLQESINSQAGFELNIGSPKQMCKWLYKDLGLKERYKKKPQGGKSISCDEEALQDIWEETKLPIINDILELRRLRKLLSTYLDIQFDTDKRIRCSYNITGTETGRLSSSATLRGTGTNLQNIPKGPIKELFLADEGKVLIDADLSQAEARVVAYLAGDERFIRVFEEGGDIHVKNAANIFKRKEEEVTSEERELAKRVVHASNYGMGPRTFARTAGIPESEAKRLLNQYFAGYPRVKIWHMQIRDTLNRTRTLTTPLGRKRVFYSRFNDQLVKEGLAFIPQSTVADRVNQALIELWEDGVDILLQVHDSIVVQCEENRVEDTIRQMKEALERPIRVGKRDLVIPSGFKVGKSWGGVKKWPLRE